MVNALKLFSLEGKTAVVTGGTSGIGYATAERLVEEGCLDIIISGRNPEKGERALAQFKKDHPEANDSISANDSLEDFDKSPKNPLNADKKLLELQLKHANTMKDLMVKQDELAKIDVPLRIAQLNQDIFNKKAQLQQVKKDIKEWDRLQKEIDVLKKCKEKTYTFDEVISNDYVYPLNKESKRIVKYDNNK